jgi:hypothetical protein
VILNLAWTVGLLIVQTEQAVLRPVAVYLIVPWTDVLGNFMPVSIFNRKLAVNEWAREWSAGHGRH